MTIDARLPNDIRNHIVAHLDGVTLKELRLAVFRQADPLFSFAVRQPELYDSVCAEVVQSDGLLILETDLLEPAESYR